MRTNAKTSPPPASKVTAESLDSISHIVEQWRRERPDLDMEPTEVIGRLSRASRVVERLLRRAFVKHGLESWEFDVLATLRRSGAPYCMTMRELLRAAMVTSGAMTNRIDQLEERGLVVRRRTSDDHRNVLAKLTPRGRALIDDVLPDHAANEELILHALSAKEREQLATFLHRILVSHGGELDADTP